MARINVFSILAFALLFSAVIALPIDIPSDSIIVWRFNSSAPYPTSAWTIPFSSVINQPQPTLPISWPNESGYGSYPCRTGTAFSTGNPYPTATGVIRMYDKGESDALALQKRRAFEGPRHHYFPHYYPYHHAQDAPASSLGSGSSSGSATQPTGTALAGRPQPTAPAPTGYSYWHPNQPFPPHYS